MANPFPMFDLWKCNIAQIFSRSSSFDMVLGRHIAEMNPKLLFIKTSNHFYNSSAVSQSHNKMYLTLPLKNLEFQKIG